MLISHLLQHGMFFMVAATASLLLIMLATSPRVWGYTDYSEAIKAKVPPQTAQEKRLALIVGIPWLIFILGFPIFSTFALKSRLGGEIPFWTALLNVFVLVTLATLGDLLILDWLIVNTITPNFVIIPGTEKADYKDFSHHYQAHARAIIPLTLTCIIIAGVVSFI